MSLNYNITLLKTIRDPLDQAFRAVAKEINDVLASNKKPSQLSLTEMTNIAGSLQMVGRPSLVRVSKDLKFSMEKIQNAERMNWDHIRIGAIGKLALNLLQQTQDHIHALERGERELGVRLFPAWSKLEIMLEHSTPSTHDLYDPDPIISPDSFAPLELEVLREVSEPYIEKFNKAFTALKEAYAQNKHDETWEQSVRQLGSVFEWAYNLRHRLGYQPYWLASRGRVALELISPASDKTSFLDAMKNAATELRKFAEDARRPNPHYVQQMMEPMLERWPEQWTAAHHVLAEVQEVFDLVSFWQAQDETRDADNQKSEVAFVAKQEELLEAIHSLKTVWSKMSGVQQADARPFLRALMSFLPKYELFPNPGVKPLMEALKAVAQRFVSAKNTDISHAFAQEVAVALLLIQETVERKGRWSSDLQAQSELTKRRVTLAATDSFNELGALPPVVWGPEKRRQQTQEAVSKVVTEVLNDLTYMEEIFDEFFRRDYEEAKSQYQVVKAKATTSSAVLRALGQNSAAAVMDIVGKCTSVLHRDGKPQDFKREYGMLTVALTGLSSFLDSFGKGDRNALSLLEPALTHFGLMGTSKDKSFDEYEGVMLFPSQGSIMPQQEKMDEEQKSAQHAFENHQGWVDRVTDPEITEAFLEESKDVLASIDQYRKILKDLPDNTDALMDLRRQFHTLKGSGRTALLWGVAEYARRVELRFNEALNKKENYTGGLDYFTSMALEFFQNALSSLQHQKEFAIDQDAIKQLERHEAMSYQSKAISSPNIEVSDVVSLSHDPEEAAPHFEENEVVEISPVSSFDRVVQASPEQAPSAQSVDALKEQEVQQALDQERLEQERLEQERLEQERLEQERLEQERRQAEEEAERERVEAELALEQERLEAERLEAERLEAERLEAERLEAERLEQERVEQARLEAQLREEELRQAEEEAERERVEAELALEQERLEAERLEAERLEQERVEQARLEAQLREEELRQAEEEAERERERVEAELALEQERLEEERRQAEEEAERERERVDAELALEQERLEQERLEQERRQAEEEAERERERVEAELALEQQRVEQESFEADLRRAEEEAQAERERVEAELALEQERLEQERLELERIHQERVKQERLAEELEREQHRLAAIRAEEERLEAERHANEAEQERLLQEQISRAKSLAHELEEEEDRLVVDLSSHAPSGQDDFSTLFSDDEVVRGHEDDLAYHEHEEENEEEERAFREDVEKHIANLLHLKNSPSIDVSLLHWSSHTLASLARAVHQPRFASMCKELENKIDVAMEQDIVLSSTETTFVKQIIAVMIEKAQQMLDTPSHAIDWDFMDDDVERQLEDFVLSDRPQSLLEEGVVSTEVPQSFREVEIQDTFEHVAPEEASSVSGQFVMTSSHAQEALDRIGVMMKELEGLQRVFIDILSQQSGEK